MSRVLPVVVWELAPGLCFGRPVFTPGELEATRRTAAAVVSALKDELVARRLEPREVEDPHLVHKVVEVRPTLAAPRPDKKKSRKLGAGEPVRLEVDVVVATLGEDLFLCEIIQFEHVFYLRDQTQIGRAHV